MNENRLLLGVAGGAALLVVCACRGPEGTPVAGTAGVPSGIADVRRLTVEGVYLAPRFSPDGANLLVSGAKYRGLYVLDALAAGAARSLTDEEGTGFQAEWTGDGVRARLRDDREIMFRDVRGPWVETGRAVDAPRPGATVHAYARADAIHLVSGGADRVIAQGDDRYYGAVVAPDGSAVAIEGLVSGISVFEVATGRTVAVGRGNHPAWLPGAVGLVHDVTTDDGHSLTSGDLWTWNRATGATTRLTDTPERVETWPAVSPDGARIAFESDGAIYTGALK